MDALLLWGALMVSLAASLPLLAWLYLPASVPQLVSAHMSQGQRQGPRALLSAEAGVSALTSEVWCAWITTASDRAPSCLSSCGVSRLLLLPS